MGLKPVTVGQLNSYISRVLKTDPILSSVSVTGEISNLKFHGSGHVYFTLKDATSKINCFLSAANLKNIISPLEEGLEIIAQGNISVYERGGYYSLNIRTIDVNGEGQLSVKFEKLKKALESEGLFDGKYKKPLPSFPKKIAVVTSPTGAAVKDIIRTVTAKNNYTDILICPVLVQGPGAAGEISSMIDYLNTRDDIDIIIAGRGGGSMEELWAFNEEITARSIFASRIPVISAVGHETDFTIADFAADFRAATPTGAAEMAVPDTERLYDNITELKNRIQSDISYRLSSCNDRVEALSPEAFAQNLSGRIMYEQINIDRIAEGIDTSIKSRIKALQDKIEMMRDVIRVSDPRLPLERGYSLVRNSIGEIIKDPSALNIDDVISVETAHGYAEASVIKTGRE
ncbi:MAG: exodeoxyribonuclease VII large subunit [Firmicutes bacterium]|nr:exodeoxyribonuclease VII large subunit [Bacillota bacterium]